MKYFTKLIVAIFAGLFLLVGNVEAQHRHHGHQMAGHGPAPDMDLVEHGPMPNHHAEMLPVNLFPVYSCYIPAMKAYVIVDSIDCAVDLLVHENGATHRVGRFTTDVYKGRHDLKNILRPVSVSVLGDKVLVLASSKQDSSYLAFVDMHPVPNADKDGIDTLRAVSVVGFQHTSYAFNFNVEDGEIVVIGKNPVGYDLSFVDLRCGLENAKESSTFHYHVPKQSERIQASDPHGAGLAIVFVSVVFFALVLICFVMKGYGALIRKFQDRGDAKASPQDAAAPSAGLGENGEVYAAIAAAIYAYEEDLHDEEDTVITIQKVERAWTPWNAKFYNMNQYFSARK